MDACRPHGAVFDTKCLQGYVGALSGVWEDTVYHLVVPACWLVCGVGGLFFLVGAGCLPVTRVWLVWFLVVLCENWIVDASILIFL